MLLCALATSAFSNAADGSNVRQSAKKRILIVLSAEDTWIRKDGSKYPTGYWAEEFVDIYDEFIAAGYIVDIATPGGKKPTADPHSLDPKVVGKEKADRFARSIAGIAKELNAPLSLAKISVREYDAIVVPGGHGPVIDLYKDKDMGKVLFAAEK